MIKFIPFFLLLTGCTFSMNLLEMKGEFFEPEEQKASPNKDLVIYSLSDA
jgi:hypothetical protein